MGLAVGKDNRLFQRVTIKWCSMLCDYPGKGLT